MKYLSQGRYTPLSLIGLLIRIYHLTCCDDMETCYGCLYRFHAKEAPRAVETPLELDEPTRILPVLDEQGEHPRPARSIAPSETTVYEDAQGGYRIVVELRIEPHASGTEKQEGPRSRPDSVATLPDPVRPQSNARPRKRAEGGAGTGGPSPNVKVMASGSAPPSTPRPAKHQRPPAPTPSQAKPHAEGSAPGAGVSSARRRKRRGAKRAGATVAGG